MLRSDGLLLTAAGTSALLRIPATSYVVSEASFREIEFRALGGGLLDLSQLEYLDASNVANQSGMRIWAWGGGRIDLSSLVEIVGAPSPLKPLIITSNGSIDLSALEQIRGGNTTLDVMTDLNLPSLTSLEGVELRLENGVGSLSMPSLKILDSCRLTISGNRSLHLPVELFSLRPLGYGASSSIMYIANGARVDGDFVTIDASSLIGSSTRTVSVRHGGILNMPNLEAVRGPSNGGINFHVSLGEISAPLLRELSGNVRLTASDAPLDLPSLMIYDDLWLTLEGEEATVHSPVFAKTLDRMTLEIRSGARFASPVTSYRTNARTASSSFDAFFYAYEPGSSLDLSSINVIDGRFDIGKPFMSNETQRVLVESGAVLNLSGLEDVLAPSNPTNKIEFASRGGLLLLGLRMINQNMRVVSANGGVVEFVRDVKFHGAVEVWLNSVLRFRGDLIIVEPDPNEMILTQATFEFAGNGLQQFEAVSIDDGLVPPSHLNLGIGRMRIGTESIAGTVVLQDAHAGGGVTGQEAVYLSALEMSPGSRLFLNDVPLYLMIDGSPVAALDLFPPGATSIEFGGGNIYRGPAFECQGDVNGDEVVDFADLNAVLHHFGTSGKPGFLPGDLNQDGVVDFFDLSDVLAGFGRECS
jgi:hypothetical protein